jgi:rubrerythrin
MKALKGTKTHDNLKAAFAGESQANRRYLYFAAKADVEGQNDVSALFRSTAEGETGHAHGHLEYLEAVGDPATNLPIGRTRENLKRARPTSTPTCTRAWRSRRATRASARSPTGSRPSPKLSAATRIGFKKRWTP